MQLPVVQGQGHGHRITGPRARRATAPADRVCVKDPITGGYAMSALYVVVFNFNFMKLTCDPPLHTLHMIYHTCMCGLNAQSLLRLHWYNELVLTVRYALACITDRHVFHCFDIVSRVLKQQLRKSLRSSVNIQMRVMLRCQPGSRMLAWNFHSWHACRRHE